MKRASETLVVSRDCEAVEIPAGKLVVLLQGTQVQLKQSLGGSYTVQTDQGYLARIEAKDADAIGQELVKHGAPQGEGGVDEPLEKQVWDQLKTCYDPEIPVNIVDLGLVYMCELSELSDGGHKVDIRMTLTAPGCGMGGVLKNDVETKVQALPGVKEMDVQLVFDPPWDQRRMSEAAKLQLNLM